MTMATIKSYTDLQQSKKLAEILPLESADMWYDNNGESIAGRPEVRCGSFVGLASINIPCWSFATLLCVLPILDNRSPVIPKTFDGKYRVLYHSTTYEQAILTSDYDNPIDACVEMILKLHELNLL